MTFPRLFTTDELLPATWQAALTEPIRIFNPAITPLEQGGYALAFRVVAADGLRRIGMVRLNSDWSVVPDSSSPWSDRVAISQIAGLPRQAYTWFADPRFIWWKNELYIYWNSGAHQPNNVQFIQKISTHDFMPIGSPKLLAKKGGANSIEKNWGLFESEQQLYAVYSLAPFELLRLSNHTDSSLEFESVLKNDWRSSQLFPAFDTLRGGAPPVIYNGKMYMVFHSITRPLLRKRYQAGVLVTSTDTCFSPIQITTSPLKLSNPFGEQFSYPRLNNTVREVMYPCGAFIQNDSLCIAYGVNDEHVMLDSVAIDALNLRTIISKEKESPVRQVLWNTCYYLLQTKERFAHRYLQRLIAYKAIHAMGVSERTAIRKRRYLVLEAMCWLVVLQALSRILPFRWQAAWLKKPRTYAKSSFSKQQLLDMIGNVVESAAQKLPWKIACYPKALVAHTMLSRYGIASQFHLAFQRKNRAFNAHAWVSSNGYEVIGAQGGIGFSTVVSFSNTTEEL
jgi:predicted GH43/DUF377 family glycosyl hydrolase